MELEDYLSMIASTIFILAAVILAILCVIILVGFCVYAAATVWSWALEALANIGVM